MDATGCTTQANASLPESRSVGQRETCPAVLRHRMTSNGGRRWRSTPIPHWSTAQPSSCRSRNDSARSGSDEKCSISTVRSVISSAIGPKRDGGEANDAMASTSNGSPDGVWCVSQRPSRNTWRHPRTRRSWWRGWHDIAYLERVGLARVALRLHALRAPLPSLGGVVLPRLNVSTFSVTSKCTSLLDRLDWL